MQRKRVPNIDPKREWVQEMNDHGVFKLDHLESTRPNFEKYISTFLLGHMQHSLSQHAEKGTPQYRPQMRMTPRDEWPWCIQIGPFRVYKTYFWKVNFHFFTRPHAAFPFSSIHKKGIPNIDPKREWVQKMNDHGVFKLDHLESTKVNFEKKMSNFILGHMQQSLFQACIKRESPI